VSNTSELNADNAMLDVSDVNDASCTDMANSNVGVTDVTNAKDDTEITDASEHSSNLSSEQSLSVEELHQELTNLRAELEAYKAAAAKQEAVANQLEEFYELFPNISVKSIPDEVWNDVKNGNSLAAAYSIYEKRITDAANRIKLINAQNAEKSAGAAGKNSIQEFFSADDVRKMSPSEVRANYAKIRRSMEKWN
jgi:hypothetical protein